MRRLVAEYEAPEPMRASLRRLRDDGHRGLDCFTPFPLEGLGEELGRRPSRIRWAMLLAGFGTALGAFLLQWWSAVYGYPINSGGRPLNSWPVFLLVPFEVGIFAAGLGGFLCLLWECGLPRLNHPLFDVPGFERATQDRFFLLAGAETDDRLLDLRHLLEGSGAIVVTEVRG